MKTVKFFMGAMALAVVSMVAAPAVDAQENKDAEGKTIRHPYLTNGLWDNWFVGAGAGFNFFYDNDFPISRGNDYFFGVFPEKADGATEEIDHQHVDEDSDGSEYVSEKFTVE